MRSTYCTARLIAVPVNVWLCAFCVWLCASCVWLCEVPVNAWLWAFCVWLCEFCVWLCAFCVWLCAFCVWVCEVPVKPWLWDPLPPAFAILFTVPAMLLSGRGLVISLFTLETMLEPFERTLL